jgi:hypothetical protein
MEFPLHFSGVPKTKKNLKLFEVFHRQNLTTKTTKFSFQENLIFRARARARRARGRRARRLNGR